MKSENEEDIAILARFIRIWRTEEVTAYKKRRESGENVPHRNSVGSKKQCT